MSEVTRSKSAPAWLHNLWLPLPSRPQLPFPVIDGNLLDSEARYQCSLTQLSYLQPVVHSKPWMVFLHNEGVAIKYLPFLLCRWSG